jgi:hypothetical protein
MSQPEDAEPKAVRTTAPPESGPPATEAPSAGPIGKLRLRERRADFAMLYREMHYCYGRLLGLEGIALWNWYRLHQHGGGKYEELTGYGWTGQPSILGAHGVKHHTTLAKIRDRLIAADLLVLARAGDVFSDDELDELRAQARQQGDKLKLQRGSYLAFVHDPLTREDFVAWSGGAQCPTCPIQRSCTAYRGWKAGQVSATENAAPPGVSTAPGVSTPHGMSKNDIPAPSMSKSDTPSPTSVSKNDTPPDKGMSKNDPHGVSKNDTYTDREKQKEHHDGDVLVQALMDHGISPGPAHKLVRDYPAQRIRDKIAWIDELRRDDPGAIRNPAGYLRRAIEEGYAPSPSAADSDAPELPEEPSRRIERPVTDFRARMAQRHGVSAELQRLWDQTRAELALQMTTATFSAYIGPHTALIALEGGAATVAVSSPYVQEWLTHRLRGVIAETLERVLGQVVEVAFVVEEG